MSITGPAMCKICGHHHYRYQPHVFGGEAKVTRAKTTRKPEPSIPAADEQPAPRDTAPAPPLHNVSQPFPSIERLPDDELNQLRRIIMAEWMRRHRARQKP